MRPPLNSTPAVSPADGAGRSPQSDEQSLLDGNDKFHLDVKGFVEKECFPGAVFAYPDEGGQPIGAVARFEVDTLCPDKKAFRQWRYDPDAPGAGALGFVSGMKKRVLPLYRLPEIVGALSVNPAQTVHFVEGEKCADALAAKGLIATTLAGGSNAKIHANVLEPLRGANVVIWTDCDKPGREYADKLAHVLYGVAVSIRLVELDAERNDGYDVADWLADGGATANLLAMAKAAPEWTPRGESSGHSQCVMIRLSDVEPEPIDWLWLGRIARRKLILLIGDPGLGKSFLTLDLAARVTTGAPWPDNSGDAPTGSVVLLSAEDDAADTIRPRIDAAKGDAAKIAIVHAVRRGGRDYPFNLSGDLDALRDAIADCRPPCALVIIDPISAYLGGIESHDNVAVRGVLAPLAALATETGAAVVAVTHLRKGEGKAIYRAMGSVAFTAAARAVWGVTRDKGNEERRLLLPVKNNIGNDKTGLAFTLESIGESARVKWEPGAVTINTDEAFDTSQRGGGESLDDACTFLKEALAAGPRQPRELFAAAKDDGISGRTLKRAKEELGITSSKTGGTGAPLMWALSKDATGEDLAPFDKPA